MFKKNKLRTQRQQNGRFIYSIYLIVTIITIGLNYIDSQLMLRVSKYTNEIFIWFIIIMFIIQLLILLIRNNAHKGINYAKHTYLTKLKLRKAFLDANYFNNRIYFNNEIADLPSIKLYFFKGFSKGRLYVENININKDISNVNISFALNKFNVDRKFLSDDERYYVFEIYDSSINEQIKFNSFKELKEWSSQINTHDFFIDKSINIPLHHTLFVGQTGAGKTYALYSLILQMLIKKVNYNIYFADPKNSSLAVLGESLSKNNTVTDIEEIIQLLKKFNDKMVRRKGFLKDNLATNLEGTYANFDFEPHVFIFDEFASFQTVLQTMEKKKRDEVMMLLSQIILQGRQLGFFLWIVMQKSDATLLPTNLRNNLPIKFVLGNAEKETYTTAFGPGAVIPEKNFKLGQGLFICPITASTPSSCHFSYLNFDILDAINNIK